MSGTLTITVDGTHTVSGLLRVPARPFACCVVAHGAGAGMTHPFMAAVAEGLCNRDVATLRFQFPYMQNGSKRPDRPPLAGATIRAAVQAAPPGLPLFAGGKSFGGRMTSQAQAEAPLPKILGLLFLGFPLHPANKPSNERALHLVSVRVPMLFLQGARDTLADTKLLVPMVNSINGTLKLLPHADHSFRVQKSSGVTDDQVLADVLDAAASWMRRLIPCSGAAEQQSTQDDVPPESMPGAVCPVVSTAAGHRGGALRR